MRGIGIRELSRLVIRVLGNGEHTHRKNGNHEEPVHERHAKVRLPAVTAPDGEEPGIENGECESTNGVANLPDADKLGPLTAPRAHLGRQDVLDRRETTVGGPIQQIGGSISPHRETRKELHEVEREKPRHREQQRRLAPAKTATESRGVHAVGNKPPDGRRKRRDNLAAGDDEADCADIEPSERGEEKDLPGGKHAV